MNKKFNIIEHNAGKCPQGNKDRQKFNPAPNTPEKWIEKALFSINEKYYGTNINGYTVNFRNRGIVNVLMKREFVGNEYVDINENLKYSIDDYIYQNKTTFETYRNFSKLINVPFYFLLTPYMYPSSDYGFSDDEKLIFLYEITDNEIKLALNFNVSELELWLNEIKEHSFNTNKPLNLADIYLSCYVSANTKNQLPGDIDYCVMYKQNDIRSTVVFLFEFKTHNINTPIKKENMDNYKKEDGNRFWVFKNLSNHIAKIQKYSPIFVYLAWGTDISLDNHKYIKLDFMSYNKELKKLEEFYTSYILNPEVSGTIKELESELKESIIKFKEGLE